MRQKLCRIQKEKIDGRNVIIFIINFVGINAVFEMIAATLVTGAVGYALISAKLIKPVGRESKAAGKK